MGIMTKNKSDINHEIDPIWDSKYESGHAEKYPWDSVVSFIFRYANKEGPRSSINVLEVGFGSGSNLWFAAREGFNVSGIEGSKFAVEYAKKRFIKDGLKGDLFKGDFTELPFDDDCFDLVINRASLCCVDLDRHIIAVNEIYRVMKKKAKFFYSGYSVDHSSYVKSSYKNSGLVSNIVEGSLQGVGQILFLSKNNLQKIFSDKWNVLSMNKVDTVDVVKSNGDIHSDWVLTLEKL
jgi:SAM-dependent methyltransferase